MSEQEKEAAFAAIEAAKAGAMTDDPFADETPTVTGATTTGTSAPVAGSRSRTEPKSAQNALGSDRQDEVDWEGRQKAAVRTLNEEAAAQRQAVEQAADDMFGEAGNGSAAPAPAGAKTRQRKPKAGEPVPEPVKVPSGSGDVIDFDDLFKD